MEDSLKLVGRTSNEIFLLRYPSTVLGFCSYDLAYFAKCAIDACNEAQKTGKPDADAFAQLRRDLQSLHCYVEHHIRTTYEKVAIDCYIDYLCHRDNIGTGTLWNRYISCRTPFDKMIFARLCEFRYNRAINQWLNIVRVQDYAKSKIDFVFTKDVKSAKDAASRRNYFDLMFSVTAREMGCRLEDLAETKVFSVGRTPGSPFMFSAISKDIIRHVLADFDYSDDYSDIGDYSETSDQIAMDAFAKMKAGLPAELSSYNIVRGKMENYTDRIYMPCSLKAVVDLEIDAIIESGGILCACKRCGKLYLRSADYDEDYCHYLQNGKSCLEIYREEHPEVKISPELEQKSRGVVDEVYSRVGRTMNEKEYESWYSYLNSMKEKVISGEISPEELDSFLDYSLNVDISRSKPIVEVRKPDERPTRERVVKPFVPERISRSEMNPKPEPAEEKPEEETPKDGFFTSPTVFFRRRNEDRQISHIIRDGEQRGESPNPGGFTPFVGVSEERPSVRSDIPRQDAENYRQNNENYSRNAENSPDEYDGRRIIPNEINRQNTENYRQNNENYSRNAENLPDEYDGRRIIPNEINRQNAENYQRIDGDYVQNSENSSAVNSRFVPFSGDEGGLSAEDSRRSAEEKPAVQPDEPPKPRVIRKNAAAISAYGKMSGAAVVTAPPRMNVVSESFAADSLPQSEPEEEPFRDIGSIFDVLEQSENGLSGNSRDSSFIGSRHPEPEKPQDKPQNTAEIAPITKENAPAGIWTEERNLFTAQSELDMLKEKKHAKSNKTQRLYDVIMREPDDNPNFRR